MFATQLLNRKPVWLESVLNRIERFLWNSQERVDTSNKVVYVFKPFPASLKPSQQQDWGRLQSGILSPFSHGDCYYYLSRTGICLWATPTKLLGVPETAAQQSLPDGEHLVQGVKYQYIQYWQDGIMQTCRQTDTVPATTQPQKVLTENSWAKPRNIDRWLRQPVTWLAVAVFVWVSVLVWHLGATFSYSWQLNSLQADAAELEQEVGDKLTLQATLQQQQSLIRELNQKRIEHGFLPQSIALVVERVLEQGPWRANQIEWQNKILAIELVLPNANIPELVSSLEAEPKFAEVAIRPNARENTWNLEVKVR